MIIKRFTLINLNEQHISANIYDNGTFIASISLGEELIVELLNSLNDENEQLKTLVDFYKDFQKDARELAKENEELKSKLKIYRNIANCSNCNYHNYDWYDDGDEFEVCDKGNDMWYRICKDWREL